MPWKWYNSEVIKIEDHSPTIKRFWVKIPGKEVFDFKAGQFVTLDLPISERRIERWRSYSIANAPDQSNVLEFCIVRLENGQATAYLFNEVTVGTTLRLKGPSGNFTLPDKIEKDLVLVSTGTTVVPFRSMLWDIYNQGKTHRQIHLIFGTRHQDGILYRDEFVAFKKKIPGFKYSVALSREPHIDPDQYDFDIRFGYVHQVYLEDYKKVRPDVAFYVCGWSNMIDDTVAHLIVKLGYDRSQVHIELYG